jgi:ribosomal protein S13
MKKRHENNEKARKEMADKKDDTVPRWMKDDFNLYDVVLTYLDENEIMESVEHAEAIMEQLTAEQIESIVEEVLGEQSSTRSMVDQVTDALPWNRNTKYTTQGVRRKPGENVHGQQTGRRPPGTASMSAGGTAPTNRPPGTGGKLVQRNR